MEAHQARNQECNLLARLTGGAVELTGKDFQFRGASYRAADARRLLEQVHKELDEDFAWMGDLDRHIFLVHLAVAAEVGETARRELEGRYRFHLAVQEIHGQISAYHNAVQMTLSQLSGRGEVPEAEFRDALNVFRQARDTLCAKLEAAGRLRLPALKNFTPGEPLGPFLLSRPLVYRLAGNAKTLDGEWIGEFLGQFGEVLDKARRILLKSLGGILALQEEVVGQWLASRTNAASGHPAGPPKEAGRTEGRGAG
jgi:hypothetical protein